MFLPLLGGLLGGLIGATSSSGIAHDNRTAEEKMAEKNIAMQKEFAQHGIRWKMEDAAAAGIHPLAALGANTTSFSPVSVGSQTSDPWGDFARNTGNDISRALSVTQTEDEKAVNKLKLAGMKADLDGKLLDNQVRLSQVQKLQTGPSFPGSDYLVSGQPSSGLIQTKPMERTASAPGALHQEPGAITDVGYAKTKYGLVPIPSKDVKERIEDNFIQEVLHAFRNNLLPNFGFQDPPPGGSWRWSIQHQSYVRTPKPSLKRDTSGRVKHRRGVPY